MESALLTYTLLFKKPFQLAHGTRTGSDALFLKLEQNGKSGFSEATFPPYLSETVALAIQDLEKINFNDFYLPSPSIKAIISPLNHYELSPFSRALAANCLLDLNSKLLGISLHELMGVSKNQPSYKSSITITKSDLSSLQEKIEIAQPFSHMKLKLDGKNDLAFVNMILAKINKPFCVDVNQGWENLDAALVLTNVKELKNLGCELIEQPFSKSNFAKHKALMQEGIIDVFADESIQNFVDLDNYHANFNGINIKVLKCGGIDNALAMAKKAKELNKRIIVGCMSESSCGCATAFALEGFADYFDIDGPWLIQNDPYTGFKINKGKFETQSNSGIGVEPIKNLWP